MQRIGLLLLGMASLVASSVIMDRRHVGLNTIDGGIGQQTVQGIRGGGIGGSGNVLTKDELLRQKFILEILQQVYLPLQQKDLLILDDVNIITNEDLYMRPLTQDMIMVLDLIASKQLLGKQTICNINNELHMHQIVGFYRLLVNAVDFDTFKRLVVYGRQHLNTEIFVNCLILALSERHDTQMLIVPALYEILPQRFLNEQVTNQVRYLDTGFSSVKPQFSNVLGMGRRNMLINSQIYEQPFYQDGLLGVLNKSQLWLPWRQLHKQMAMRKMMRGNIVPQQLQSQADKLVITVPGNGLLTQDLGFKSYVSILIDELIVNQDTVKNLNENQVGFGGQEYDIQQEDSIFSKREQMGGLNNDYIEGGSRRNRVVNDMNSQYGTIISGDNIQSGINTDRLLNVGRRLRDNEFGASNEFNMNGEPDIGRRQGLGMNMGGHIYSNLNGNRKVFGQDTDINDQYLSHFGGDSDKYNEEERFYKNRLNIDDEISLNRNMYLGQNRKQTDRNDINSVSTNDARLLFVGRRNKGPNSVVNMGGSSPYNYDNDDLISGGRRVSNDERKKNKHNYDNNDDEYDYQRYTNGDKRDRQMTNFNDYDYDDLIMKIKYRDFGKNINSRYNQQLADSVNYGNYYDQDEGQGLGIGRGRDDFLNMFTRGQRKFIYNDQNVVSNPQRKGDSLDKYLPTTNINDERLLHVNRRKLNYKNQGNVLLNDYDRYNTGYQPDYQTGYVNSQGLLNNEQTYRQNEMGDIERYNSGYSTGYYNSEDDSFNRENTKQQNKYRDNQNGYLGDREIDIDVDSGNNNRGERHGRRNRRSIVNQNSGQPSTINGKLIVFTLQQLVARLNLERIALGLPLLIDDTQKHKGLLTENTLGRTNIQGLDIQTVNKIENVIQQFDIILQQKIGQITVASYSQKVNEIGLILAGQIKDLGLIDILGEIIQPSNQQLRNGLIANAIENEGVQLLLAGIVKVVDSNIQRVYNQRKEFVSTVQSININNVEIGKLQTYLEQTDIDLTNLLEETNQGINKVVIGRVARLNYKSFNIEIDVTSDRPQQVVVRNLLVPKVDGQNNVIPLIERRQNVIVLDINTVQLQQGRSTLNLNSEDNILTSRDTTPITKIYQLVMQSLNGGNPLQQDLLVGQTSLLPQRLLLPRGRINGLPMQLITVITPLQSSATVMGIYRGSANNGLNILQLDRLPLNYPLHCDLTDLDKVTSMPNLMVKDVKIYHEDNIQTPFSNMY